MISYFSFLPADLDSICMDKHERRVQGAVEAAPATVLTVLTL